MILRCYKCKHAWKDDPVEGQTAFECPKCATLVLVGDFTETTALPRPASLRKAKDAPVLPEDQPIAPAARLASGTPTEAPKVTLRPPSPDETQDFSKTQKDIDADATDTSRFPPIPDPGNFADKEPTPSDATPPGGVPVPTKAQSTKPAPAPPKPTAIPPGPVSKAAMPKPPSDDDGPEDLSDMPTSMFRPEDMTDPKATRRKGAKKPPPPPPKPAPRLYHEDEQVRPEELHEEPTRMFSASELTAPTAPAAEDDGGRYGINEEPTRIFSAAELTAMEGQETSVDNRPPKPPRPSLENEQTRMYTAAELMALEGTEDDGEATIPPPMAPPPPKAKAPPEPALPPLPTQVFSTREWDALNAKVSGEAPEEQTLSPFAAPPAKPAPKAPAPPQESLPPMPTRVFSTREWDAPHEPPPPPPPAAPAASASGTAAGRTPLLSPRGSMLDEEIGAEAARIPGASDAISTADTQPEEGRAAFPSMASAMRRDTIDSSKPATRPITPRVPDAPGEDALETPIETILTEDRTPTPKQWILEQVKGNQVVVRPEDAKDFDSSMNMTQVSFGPPPGLLAALLETDLPIAHPTPAPKQIRNMIDEELGDFT